MEEQITPSEVLPKLLTPKEVSKMTKGLVGVVTLAKWRCERRKNRKRPPLPFVKFGGRILYKAGDVAAFIASQTRMPGEGKPRKSKRKLRAELKAAVADHRQAVENLEKLKANRA